MMMIQDFFDPSPLQNLRPKWFFRHHRQLSKYRHHECCYIHDTICKQVAFDLQRLLHPQPEEEEKKVEIKLQEKMFVYDISNLGVEPTWTLEKGKIYDLVDLLSGRDQNQKQPQSQAPELGMEEGAAVEEEIEIEMAGVAVEEEWHIPKTKKLRKEESHIPKTKKSRKEEKSPLTPIIPPQRRRDYLIKHNKEKVKIKDVLNNKYVLLYFAWLSKCFLKENYFQKHFIEDLKDVYSTFHEEFKLVFIALGDDEEVFHACLNRLPWLAIPLEDKEARDHFIKKFSIPSWSLAKGFLFGPDGKLLDKDCQVSFDLYGSKGFPFTEEKIEELTREDDTLRKELSLHALLGNFVMSCQGEEVPTSELENKIVGLHFFNASNLGIQRTRKLLEIWKSLSDEQRSEFKIVLINDDTARFSSFKDVFVGKLLEPMPWFSLFFDGKQLCRVFKVDGIRFDYQISVNAGYLIIIQPEKPLSYFAFDIMENYGVDAFPFTLESAVIQEKRRQEKDLVLEKLLSPTAPLRRGGSTCYEVNTRVSELSGKHVLLLFATSSSYGAGQFLAALKRMYHEKKGTDDQFEIIYISLDCEDAPSSFSRCIRVMPWLVHAFVPDFAAELLHILFEYPACLPAIAAFGPDGRLQTKESNLLFKKGWTSTFPFIQDDMSREVCKELIYVHKWAED